VLDGVPKKQNLGGTMKRSGIRRWLIGVILCAFAQSARAEGFSVGAGFGLPSLIEVRVGYEARDFGVRTYLDLVSLWAGADGYAKLPVRDSGLSLRLGAGLLTDFKSVGFRGVIGAEWVFVPNAALVFEYRPIFLISSSASSSDPFVNILYAIGQAFLIFSFTVALEYRF
jgi:hypothetical protein